MVYQHKLGIFHQTRQRLTYAVMAMIFLISVTAASLALYITNAHATATVVSPSSLNGWFFINDDDTAADTANQGSFVAGPTTPPLGSGSAKLTAGPGQYDLLFGRAAHNMALSDITDISFQTYTEQNDAPSFQIGLDIDSTDGSNTFGGRAVYQPQATIGSWSSIVNPLADTNPNWWLTWSGDASGDNPCTQAAMCTWDELKTALPNAQINVGWGFKADKDVSIQSISHVDNVTFNGTTYDFEPDTAPEVPQTLQTVLQSDFANSWSTWTYHDDVKDSSDPLNAANRNPTENHKITANPSPEPGNNGAVRLYAEPGTEPGKHQRWNLATIRYSGKRIADITALGFDVRASTPGKAYINLDINFNSWKANKWKPGSGINFNHGRLVYVPEGVSWDSWSTHEAVAGGSGVWTWSNFDKNDGNWPDGSTQRNRTWNDIVIAFPDAYISSTLKELVVKQPFGGFGLRADGSGGPHTVYYDNVYLATADENIKYNFELEETMVAPSNLGIIVNSENIGCDAVARVNLATARWNPVDGVESYDYEVTYGGTKVYAASLLNPSNTGAFGGGQNGDWAFRVRSVFPGSVTSAWSEYCNVELDTSDSEVPQDNNDPDDSTSSNSGSGTNSNPPVQNSTRSTTPLSSSTTLAGAFTTIIPTALGDGIIGATISPLSSEIESVVDDGEVLGAEDDLESTFGSRDILGQTATAQDVNNSPLKAFGILWYWWLAAFAVFAATWWLIAAKRRKQTDEVRI